ncbi:MAG: DUF3089 domain-containing protein [Bacteroidetes bacterium]|nr:DUF3089 domain-containing protein [Bacteroidota bacterium]
MSIIPDYNNLYYWAAHPWKKDASDSIPKELRINYHPDSTADVFFIHPTTLTGKNDYRWNAPVNDSVINRKTDKSTILYQASVFNESCRVFAPRYRQANLKAFFINQDSAAPYFDTAYTDIKNAFLFYLQHYNNGRPIIIAAHSQGTKHAARLLKEFFENKPLQQQLVCVYLIGLPVPADYFTSLTSCKDSLSTGCIISWRTFKRGYTEPYFVAKEQFKAIVVNPLSWTTDTLFEPASKNTGGVLLKFNKIIPHVVNANIHGNVLWVSKPKFFGNIFFTKKNYHIGDINLFYMNIRQNIKARIVSFLKKQQQL